MEVILVLHNLRSTYNVGAILRSAEGLGVETVYCSGYTPFPYTSSKLGKYRPSLLPHVAETMARRLGKTALGAEKMLDVSFAEDIETTLADLKSRGYQLVGLENRLEYETVKTNDPELKQKLGEKIVLVLGEEVSGIPDPLLHKMDTFLEIPMKGQKESFNVSVAASLTLYALLVA